MQGWLAKAKKHDKNATIVTKAPEAIALIQASLKKAGEPLNITDIAKLLKSVVPDPILRHCLDVMSDSSEKSRKELKRDMKANTALKVVPAKDKSANLYYCYEEDARSGYEQSETQAKVEQAKSALDETKKVVAGMESTAKTLNSQPVNSDLDPIIEERESDLESLKSSVTDAKENAVDERQRKKVARSLEVRSGAILLPSSCPFLTS